MPQTTTKPWQRQAENINRNDRHEPHWPISTPSYHLGGIPSFGLSMMPNTARKL